MTVKKRVKLDTGNVDGTKGEQGSSGGSLKGKRLYCQYVLESNHNCSSPFAKTIWGGSTAPYPVCRSHAVKLGLVDDTRKKRNSRSIEKEELEKSWKSGTVDELFNRIVNGNNEIFNAYRAYPPLEKMRPIPGDEQGAKKYLFGLWVLASKRKPKRARELAELLGVSEYTLDQWYHSPWFAGFLSIELDRSMVVYRKFVDQVVLEAAKKGDLKAQRLFYDRSDKAAANLKVMADLVLKSSGSSEKENSDPDRVDIFDLTNEGEGCGVPGRAEKEFIKAAEKEVVPLPTENVGQDVINSMKDFFIHDSVFGGSYPNEEA